MTPQEFLAVREAKGMTQAEFGRWLAEQVSAKPYSGARVSDWENGHVGIPARIIVVLQQDEIKRLRAQLGLPTEADSKPERKPKP